MALTLSRRVKQMPHDAPGGGDFARDENKDFYISRGQEIEIYHCVTDASGAAVSIQTAFEKVHGGYVYNATDDTTPNTIDVKPNADPTIADISGLPAAIKNLTIVIFGYKVPNALV